MDHVKDIAADIKNLSADDKHYLVCLLSSDAEVTQDKCSTMEQLRRYFTMTREQIKEIYICDSSRNFRK